MASCKASRTSDLWLRSPGRAGAASPIDGTDGEALAPRQTRVDKLGNPPINIQTSQTSGASNRDEENIMIGRLIIATGAQFSEAEFEALRSLRTKYRDTHHLFTEHELAHLRFQRWLVRSPYWHRSLDRPHRDVV